MRSSTTLIAAGMLFAASIVTAQTYGADTVQGCYKDLDNFVFNETFMYNTDGSCQKRCAPAGYQAMATTKGTDCWCGNVIPSDADKVDSSYCNVPCAGFGANMCGGAKYWTVYISGLVAAELVSTAGGSAATSASSNASPSATKTSAPSVVTVGGQTVVVTAGSSTSNSSSPSAETKSSGPNKAAIAAGVVVGIVAIAAVAGGAFLFMRNKKRREVEEEYRRNAAVSSFIAGGGKAPSSSAGSFSDTRLDPSVAQRRMSDGSIADNQDYSRRILKVTNA